MSKSTTGWLVLWAAALAVSTSMLGCGDTTTREADVADTTSASDTVFWDTAPPTDAVDASESDTMDADTTASDTAEADTTADTGADTTPTDTTPPECTPSQAGACDDSDPCTADRCTADGRCTHEVDSGAVCDDDDPCTQDDTCNSDGLCVGEAYTCTPSASCLIAACDGAGGCTEVVEAGSCAIDGVCYSAGDLNPSDACETCKPTANRGAWSLVEVGTACGDVPGECGQAYACNAVGACVGQGYVAYGTTCGDGPTPCSGQDTCDGVGRCVPNDKPADSVCGDAGTECIAQDRCDGNGQCVDEGFASLGTACGSGPTECSAQDTCNGTGVCQTNDHPATRPCGTLETECDLQDHCDGIGSCIDGGAAPAGRSCGDAGTECRNQDACDGAGQCTDHGFKPSFTPCGVAPDLCELQDTCDGAGGCIDSGLRAPGTVCHASIGGCDPAEKCDGVSGACPADFVQPQDADCGTCKRCDDAGQCVGNSTDHSDCGGCQMCSGGSCVNQDAGLDVKGDCPTLGCTDFIAGWSGNSCVRYTANSLTFPRTCTGAGTCSPVTPTGCSGTSTVAATCGDAACLKACVPAALARDYDSPQEVCYTDLYQHGCGLDYACGTGGTCIFIGTCPYLYTWDGDSFAFETDIYGSGKVGVQTAGGNLRPVPDDYYVLANTPATIGGELELRLVEERSEIDYLDAVTLYAVDAPIDRDVMTELQAPSFPYLALQDAIHTVSLTPGAPVSVVHLNSGLEVGAKLAAADGDYLVLNADRNHDFDYQTLELDLGDLSAAPQIKLIVDGRTAFPNDADGYARKTLFGARTRIEVLDAAGQWVTVPTAVAALAPPKEGPRPFVLDLTDAFPTTTYRVRLTFLFKTQLDYLAVDTTADVAVRLTELPLVSAELRFYGLSDRVVADDILVEYLYGSASVDIAPPYSGAYTQYGEVTPLLTRQDDMFVIFWSGDELGLRFTPDTAAPADVTRRYLLHSHGYYKDASSDLGTTVEPLPFGAMSNYPYDEAVERYPDDLAHQQYRATYNTRTY